MTKITTMNKAAVGRIATSAKEALGMICEEFGITIQKTSGSYDEVGGTFSMRVIWEVPVGDGNIPRGFLNDCGRFDLTADDWGMEFTAQGDKYTLCGLSPRSRKYPILGKSIETGKTYKFTRNVLPQKDRDHTFETTR